MNITITGDIGSGKSTVAHKLAEVLNMNVVETGELYREYAKEKNRDVLSQNQSDDWSIDRIIDSKIETMGKNVDNTIFVSRLAWHFIPNAVHVYLAVNPVLAAKRIYESKSRVSESHTSWKETLRYNKERKELELKRYADMYGIEDPSGYNAADYIVIVGKNSVDDVVECLTKAIQHNRVGTYIDPKVILPTQAIRDFNANVLNRYIEIYGKTDLGVNAIINHYSSNYYCVDGHHRIVASIKNKAPFILVPTIETVNVRPTVCTVYDYEDIAGIRLDDEMYLHENALGRDEIIFKVLSTSSRPELTVDQISALLPKAEMSEDNLLEAINFAIKTLTS